MSLWSWKLPLIKDMFNVLLLTEESMYWKYEPAENKKYYYFGKVNCLLFADDQVIT
jgi:hypothetical protein